MFRSGPSRLLPFLPSWAPLTMQCTFLILDPSLHTIQMILSRCLAKVCARLLSRGRTTWMALQSVQEQSPRWFPGPFLPSYPPPLIPSCICCFSHSLMWFWLRFSISKQFTSVFILKDFSLFLEAVDPFLFSIIVWIF